ncbi:hypothetical protein [Burkholderia cepacia]|uniref:hypothetical protein n=1 Tax=Burkholderia cepacia TaxID=292 RepID=UPI003857D6A7
MPASGLFSGPVGEGNRTTPPFAPEFPLPHCGVARCDDTANDRDTSSQRCADLDTTASNASVIFRNVSQCPLPGIGAQSRIGNAEPGSSHCFQHVEAFIFSAVLPNE